MSLNSKWNLPSFRSYKWQLLSSITNTQSKKILMCEIIWLCWYENNYEMFMAHHNWFQISGFCLRTAVMSFTIQMFETGEFILTDSESNQYYIFWIYLKLNIQHWALKYLSKQTGKKSIWCLCFYYLIWQSTSRNH